MLKTLTIIILAALQIIDRLPPLPDPDPILGVLFGMFAGVLLIGYMAFKASMVEQTEAPRQHSPAQPKYAVQRQPARKPTSTRRIATSVYGFQPVEVFA